MTTRCESFTQAPATALVRESRSYGRDAFNNVNVRPDLLHFFLRSDLADQIRQAHRG
jgi:hypothetical protein